MAQLGKVFKGDQDKFWNAPFPLWKVRLWNITMFPIAKILDFGCKHELIGGYFITPWGALNKKTYHEDGSRSIRFYDKYTIL